MLRPAAKQRLSTRLPPGTHEATKEDNFLMLADGLSVALHDCMRQGCTNRATQDVDVPLSAGEYVTVLVCEGCAHLFSEKKPHGGSIVVGTKSRAAAILPVKSKVSTQGDEGQ